MTDAVLFCADPLSGRRVDDHFAREAEAVRELGGTVILVDEDLRVRGDAARVLYRGWMLPAARYAALAAVLAARGTEPVTSPAAYAAAHELPGWYAAFADVTPASAWRPGPPGEVPTEAELAALVAPLGPGAAIVKDYVKSRKHEWESACFVPDVRDLPGLRRVVAEMIRLQDDGLNGGVVVRGFEAFAPGEVRVWWYGGAPILVSPHPDAPASTGLGDADLAPVAAAVARLGAPFVTTDLARGERGWRVVEVGDAQVSDLHRDTSPFSLWRPLLSGGFDKLGG